MNADEHTLIDQILLNSKRIAVVGISDRPDRPSFQVANYLAQYFEIIPVNPTLTEWQGEKCYPSLQAIPKDVSIDLVDVFRRSSDVPPVVEDAIARGVRYIWLQQGIINEEAAARSEAAGIPIIMDACLAVEHSKRRKR